ncbi:MAG: hypothetical protein ACLP5H_04185 [Desulfomonilaceae bacterium]
MGSIRTLQKGKKAYARQQELEGILRHAKTEIVDLFSPNGFEVCGDWIQVHDHHQLVFVDTKVGAGGVRVFRRNSCGRFYAIHFHEDEDLHWDSELYAMAERTLSKVEKLFSAADLNKPSIRNSVFRDFDWFMHLTAGWIRGLIIACPECGGTGKKSPDDQSCECAACEGSGDIERDSLA